MDNCKSLEKLGVGWCRKLTDPGIIAIAENCKGLKELNVAYASPQRRPLFPRCESHARPTPLSSASARC